MRPIQKKFFINIGVFWLLFVVIIIAVYAFGLRGVHREANQIIERLSNEIAKLNNPFGPVGERGLHMFDERLEMFHERYSDFVVEPDYVHNFPLKISQIAKKIGIRSISTKGKTGLLYSEIPNCERIVTSHINISWTGTYRQFAQLVNALERYRPVILIDRFRVSRSSLSSKLNEINIGLVIIVEKPELKSGERIAQAVKNIG